MLNLKKSVESTTGAYSTESKISNVKNIELFIKCRHLKGWPISQLVYA